MKFIFNGVTNEIIGDGIRNVASTPNGQVIATFLYNRQPEMFNGSSWIPVPSYEGAVDIATNGIAIGKDASKAILINGKWAAMEKAAPSTPGPWKDSTVSFLDISPKGWILARRGNYDAYEHAVLLPLLIDGVNNADFSPE